MKTRSKVPFFRIWEVDISAVVFAPLVRNKVFDLTLLFLNYQIEMYRTSYYFLYWILIQYGIV